MPVIVTLDAMLARRRMRARELAAAIGVSETHLSQFRNGNVKGVRFSTLSRLCAVLECKPGDLLDYVEGKEKGEAEPRRNLHVDRGDI